MVKVNLSDINVPELIADIWSPLNDEQREFLANHFTLQNYKKNEVIHCEGETPTHLMCLLSGKVKIYKDGVGGRSQIIRMIKPVEYFGYRPYFAKTDYVTAASAFEPSLVCQIPMTALMTLLTQNNDLAMFFIKQLSVDLGIADERTVNLTQKHIRGRLAESLLFLKESYGLEEDGSTLSIYLSREDLANLSNMTTSNAIRTLSQFATERLITIDGRKIKIIMKNENGMARNPSFLIIYFNVSIARCMRASVSSLPNKAVISNMCGPLHSPTTARRKAFITLPM